MAAALLAATIAVAGAGGASAQSTTGDPEPTTTVPAPPTTAPPDDTTTSTTPPPTPPPPPPGPDPTPAPTPAPTAPPLPPNAPRVPTSTSSTTTTTLPPAPPATAAPVPLPPTEGGDSAEPPPGTTPEIPPELLARMRSVRRSAANGTARLLGALAPLRAMGMTEQEAVHAGFGRFPVGGRATFTDDWWFLRFGPAPGQVRLHEGTDIFAPYGTPVRAPAAGVLRQSFNLVGGLAAYVVEPDGTYYYLAHLSRFEAGQVSGQAVRIGDVIGYLGDSGNARGSSPHVHFEIHPRGGGPVNPKSRLDTWLREALAAVPRVVADAAPRLATRPQVAAEEQELAAVGHSDLGGGGSFGAVAVAGDTALVARDFRPAGTQAGETCAGTVVVADLSNPFSPRTAATIALPEGQRAEDVDALAVRTAAFSGDLAAVVVGPCLPGDGATGLAYYDVSDPRRPRLLARVPHPRELADGPPGDDACSVVLRATCTRAGRSVDLQQTSGGRVLSLSSAGGRDGASRSDVYAVDVTDPRAPRPVGWNALAGRTRPPASSDGCSPVALSAPPPTEPRLSPMLDITGFRWQADAAGVASAGPDAVRAYPTVVDAAGRRLAVVTDDDWWSSSWALRVDPPAALAGDRTGCPGPLAGGDLPASAAGPAGSAGPTAGAVVYVGRGCPERRGSDGVVIPADPYLADPAGRIAVVDAALAPVQAGLSEQGCSPASRLARARHSGALGVVVAGSFQAAAPAGEAILPDGGGGGGGAVPGLQLRKPDGDVLRDALCPPTPGGACVPAGELPASMVELPGQWGGLRVVDVTNPEAPRQVEAYATANGAAASPADPGRSFAAHAIVADGTRIYAAWGSDGLRVLDLATGAPVEVADFLPPSVAGDGDDPAAGAGPYVAGVDHTTDHIVVSDVTTGLWVVEKRPPAGSRGYWMADASGGVFAFGDAGFFGSAADAPLASPIVGLTPSPSAGGYWLVARDGGVFAFGNAAFAGSLAGGSSTAPVVGLAPTPSGRGYWMAAADGGVFAFGDAPFLGSLAGTPPSSPVVAVVATPSGKGYWLVSADGGVFAYGDAPFLGAATGATSGTPVVAAATTATGRGYWLVAADGGVFPFGDARFKGSMTGQPLPGPVVGAAAMTGWRGYWLAGGDGAVYALGGPYLGNRPAEPRAAPVVAMASVPRRPTAAPTAAPAVFATRWARALGRLPAR